MLGNYLLAFDPAACPFQREDPKALSASSQRQNTDWWRPNTIDVLCIRRIRRIKLFAVDRSRLGSLQQAFNEVSLEISLG